MKFGAKLYLSTVSRLLYTGQHTIKVRKREDGTGLDTIGFEAVSGGTATPTPANTPVVPPTPTQTPSPTPTSSGSGCSSPVGNLIANPGFDSDKSNWIVAGSYTRFRIVNDGPCGKVAKVKVTQSGGVKQLYQFNLSLTTGTTYRIGFDARSASGNNVKLFVHRHTPVLSLSKGRPTPTMD